MKPHIFFKFGRWWCRTGIGRRSYVGANPKLAYEHWYRINVWHAGPFNLESR